MRTPNCCAVRASLTREEITTAACSATSADAGPTRKTSTNVRAVNIASNTPGGAASAMPVKYNTRPAMAMASVGASAPSTLATSSSSVVIGVASSGSSVRACFSPTTACDASDIAPVIGNSRNNMRNCWNRKNCTRASGPSSS